MKYNFLAVHSQGGYISKAYDLLRVSDSISNSLDVNFNKIKKSEICTVPIDYMLPVRISYSILC